MALLGERLRWGWNATDLVVQNETEVQLPSGCATFREGALLASESSRGYYGQFAKVVLVLPAGPPLWSLVACQGLASIPL